MNYLHTFNETFTNGLSFDSLTIISSIAVLCGLLVIIEKNPIVSVLFLIGLFLSIAIYLMMLGIHFIGLAYLLVYVGAVSILFLFILMLINVRISELVTDNNNSIPLAVTIGVIFSSTLYNLFPNESKSSLISSIPFLNDIAKNNKDYLSSSNNLNENIKNLLLEVVNSKESTESVINISILKDELYKGQDISFVTSSTWDGALTEFSHITSIGNILYTVYPMWLIITSLILLLAMVGAIVITIKK